MPRKRNRVDLTERNLPPIHRLRDGLRKLTRTVQIQATEQTELRRQIDALSTRVDALTRR